MSRILLDPLRRLLDPVDGSAARDAARRELERTEYHRDDPGVVQRVLDWIGDRFASLFSGGPGGSAMVLLIALVVVTVVVLALRAGRPTRRRRAVVDGAEVPDELRASADSREHRRIAARLEADGRPAEALREWLRAAVASIEERGVLPPRPGRTGAATAREAAPALPAAADVLGTAMTAFEQVWFGGRSATTADVTGAHAAADAVARARIVVTGTPAPDLARW